MAPLDSFNARKETSGQFYTFYISESNNYVSLRLCTDYIGPRWSFDSYKSGIGDDLMLHRLEGGRLFFTRFSVTDNRNLDIAAALRTGYVNNDRLIHHPLNYGANY